MTDARFPERWLSDRRILRLSDLDYRTFVTALVWSVSNRTDGVIERDDLPLVVGATQESAAALVAAGLWADQPDGWIILDFDSTQTSAHQLQALDNVRRYDRDRKALQRQGKPGPDLDPSRQEPPVRVDIRTENTGQDRLGQDRLGEEELPDTPLNETEVSSDRSSSFRRRPAA